MSANSSEVITGPLAQLVGVSVVMRQLRALVRRIAAANSTVLLLGESGTGKELVAQAVHALSPRGRNNFVPVNCGAIPAELLESELFGHRKGAYTGAFEDRKGRFEMANSGTLFLDEIGDMRLEMQVKLLRVLQERVVDRVGDDAPRPVDVRVIAATHRHLEDAVTDGRFRADLFYRLNVFPIQVPALRDRDEDVLVLFEHFARSCAQQNAGPVEATGDLQEWMMAHSWPGNCRELLNFVERLSVLWPGRRVHLNQIPASMLPRRPGVVVDSGAAERAAVLAMADWEELALEDASSPGPVDPVVAGEGSGFNLESVVTPAVTEIPTGGVDLRHLLAEYEAAWIRNAMRATAGNITHAADLLCMRRTTFLERLRKYQLSDFRG